MIILANHSRSCGKFIDVILQSPNPIPVIDLSHVNFDNIDECDMFSEILGSYSEDKLYRFVLSKDSPMFKLNYVGNTSFEWDSDENAVEVYKLPATLKWPTMYCAKQLRGNYVFPEFIIRRMNVMHRHRVNATMNRLWLRTPGSMIQSLEMVVWLGSPGCGKSVAISEIILECILKLQELGNAYNETNWQFYFRNNTTLFKFFFDAHSKKVSHASYEFSIKENMLAYLRDAYEKNTNSFVIFELNENETFSTIEMSFLLSISCHNLDQSLKEVFKTDNHATYLYDPMLDFEFKFFLDVCFAFGNTSNLHPKAEYLDRFRLQGGVLRKIFSKKFEDPVLIAFANTNGSQKEALTAMSDCSPVHINSAVSSIVTVRFDYPDSFDENHNYQIFRDLYLKSSDRFFPDESVPFEYFHWQHNWCLDILSDHIALAIGTQVRFPRKLGSSFLYALFQVQELMSIYGGILKVPTEVYKLPDCFMMESWTFYECSSDNFNSANREHIKANNFRVHTSICHAAKLGDTERSSLIAIMPSTSKISYFIGQYLELPFTELSTDYVYKSTKHNCPVYDAMSANPALRQLFFFQATLDDPSLHAIKIPSFNLVLSKLHLDDPASIDDIYFFMIISAHDTIESQHFFSFRLASLYFNACYFQVYTSTVGLRALRRIISVDSKCTEYLKIQLSEEDVLSIPMEELDVLKSIRGCYSDKSYYKITLSESLHKDLWKFLNVASKIKSYICRAPFMASDGHQLEDLKFFDV